MTPDIHESEQSMLSIDQGDESAKVAPAATAVPGQRRGARGAARQAQSREPMRDAPRSSMGRIEVRGRGGEILSRKRTQVGDIFEIPAELIPDGWEYQWCAVSIYNNADVLLGQNLLFAENGWRPVPTERYPGRFMVNGHKGPVVRDGQMLMERPKALCEEAREEDIMNARRQVSDRDQALMGGKANLRQSLGDGIAMGGGYRHTGGDLRMSIDRALDVPMPQHAPADDSIP